jgi:guanylate kinase
MIIIVGASASGKTDIAKILVNEYGFSRVVTSTTREKRPQELNDVDYHFLTFAQFQEKLSNNEFIEYTQYNKNYYGTLISDAKEDSIFVLNPDGANALYRKYKNIAKIFYLKTSKEIRTKRMISRGDSLAEVQIRIENDDLVFAKEKLDNIDYIIDTSIKTSKTLAREINNIYQRELKNHY